MYSHNVSQIVFELYPAQFHGYPFIFYEVVPFYFTNPYEWPTPNPAPKPTHHCGLDKSYKIEWVRSYELTTS